MYIPYMFYFLNSKQISNIRSSVEKVWFDWNLN